MGVRQYARYVNVITTSGSASGLHRACIGYASGTDQVITLSVELGEGGFGARPHNTI